MVVFGVFEGNFQESKLESSKTFNENFEKFFEFFLIFFPIDLLHYDSKIGEDLGFYRGGGGGFSKNFRNF